MSERSDYRRKETIPRRLCIKWRGQWSNESSDFKDQPTGARKSWAGGHEEAGSARHPANPDHSQSHRCPQMCSRSLSTRHGDDHFGHTTFQKLHLSFVKALSFALTYRANQIQIQLDSFRFCRNLLLNMGLSKPLQYNGKILYDVRSSIILRCCKVHGKNRVPLLDAYSNPSPWFILRLTMVVFMFQWRENVGQVDEKWSQVGCPRISISLFAMQTKKLWLYGEEKAWTRRHTTTDYYLPLE